MRDLMAQRLARRAEDQEVLGSSPDPREVVPEFWYLRPNSILMFGYAVSD